MPRNPENKSIAVLVTPEQLEVAHQAAAGRNLHLSDYMRDLLRQDCEAQGIEFPENLKSWGRKRGEA